MNIPDVEVMVEEATPKKKKGGRRPGAGRPSLVRLNKERMAQGLEPIEFPKKNYNKPAKSNAILPQSRKARQQELLAEMLKGKSKFIVQKVLDKALNDDDKDQMACLTMVVDRILPKEYFTKAKASGNKIEISITGVDAQVSQVETIDAEFEEDNG
jgi:hypothetical protein